MPHSFPLHTELHCHALLIQPLSLRGALRTFVWSLKKVCESRCAVAFLARRSQDVEQRPVEPNALQTEELHRRSPRAVPVEVCEKRRIGLGETGSGLRVLGVEMEGLLCDCIEKRLNPMVGIRVV